MIRGVAEKKDGGKEIFMGLSTMNVAMLMQGRPILFDAEEEWGMPAGTTVVIFFGHTEEMMAEQLRDQGLIGPGTDERNGQEPDHEGSPA